MNIWCVKEVSDHLREQIIDKYLILYVRRGPNAKYNSFISSISFHGRALTFDDPRKLILGYERMLDH